MLDLILVVLVMLVASALCSGSEAALFSLPVPKAQQLAEKSVNGRILLNIKSKPSATIAAIVISNNLFNIVGTFIASSLAALRLAEAPILLYSFPIVLTVMVIIFSEILPKNLGERYCVPICVALARPLKMLTWLLMPLVYGIEKVVTLLLKEPSHPTTNEEEIKLLARIGHQEGIIEQDERQMIERVFRLNDRKARDIMTPRIAISSVQANTPVEEAKDQIASSQHSRILVFDENDPDYLGIILKSTLLRLLVEEQDQSKPIGAIAEPAQVVFESTRADQLLALFQSSRRHLAVVLDEYGGVSGVVTLEDVLEVITGEIVDETDLIVDLQKEARKLGEIRMRAFYDQEYPPKDDEESSTSEENPSLEPDRPNESS